jgi:hypothetical protein
MKLKFFSILSSLDEGYLPFYDNFIGHLKKIGLDQEHELISIPECASGKWQSKAFKAITNQKLIYTKKFLEEGYTVFFCDLDIAILKDPIPYLLDIIKNKDLAFQHAGRGDRPSKPTATGINTGIYIVKPTPLTLELFDTAVPVKIKVKDKADGGFIQTKLMDDIKYKHLNYDILPPELFPNGAFWYKTHKPKLDPYMVHYTHLIKHSQKINKMKHYGHWVI